MNVRNFLLMMLLCLSSLSYIGAQDIHFSQFFNTPLNINPALTGVSDSEHRFQANYRSQWVNVPVDYLTFSGAYDRPITDRLDSTGYWSVGALLNYDKAGDLAFQRVNLSLSGSYTYKISDKLMITPGLSAGFQQGNFDFNAITSNNQWNGIATDFSIPAEVFDKDAISFFDLSGGLNLRYQTSYRTYLDFGGSAYHLLRPAKGFDDDSTDDKIEMRFNGYAMTSFYVAPKIDVLLNGLFSSQGPYQEFVLNAQGKLYLNRNKERNIALYLGLGIRLGDAWYPMVALQKGRWYGSASYDFNTSDFDIATGGRGGLELSLRYMFTKVPLIPMKPCPIY